MKEGSSKAVARAADKEVKKTDAQLRQLSDAVIKPKEIETKEKLKARIDKLNERVNAMRKNAGQEMLKSKAITAEVVKNLFFGMTLDGRTYCCFRYEDQQHDSQLMLAGALPGDRTGSDEEGRYCKAASAYGIAMEYREEGARIYHDIDDLEGGLKDYEQKMSTGPIVEKKEYRLQFNQENHVEERKGTLKDDTLFVVGVAKDQPSKDGKAASKEKTATPSLKAGEKAPDQDKLKQAAEIADNISRQYKAIIGEMPEWAKKTVMGRLLAGGQFVTDKEGKVLMTFSPALAPEFRACHKSIFDLRGLAIREYAGGQYAVEIDPKNVQSFLSSTRLCYTDKWSEKLEPADRLKLLTESLGGHGTLRSPEKWSENVDALNGRLRTVSERAKPEDFVKGIVFRSADNGDHVYMAHPSKGQVEKFLEMPEVKKSGAFDGISAVKAEGDQFRSADLTPGQVEKMFAYFEKQYPKKG